MHNDKSEKSVIFVTGAAGFIGFHVANTLLETGHKVIGIDNISDYYDVGLKHARLEILRKYENFHFYADDLTNRALLFQRFEEHKPNICIHLAAQAGVRYSIDAPESYVDSNLIGGFHILEAARHYPLEHLLFASTSSVYGANTKMPFEEADKADEQMSFYAATKKANESMAHSYAYLYHIPTTMFRFFTVYGPWGRPDMALFKFTKAILNDEPIDIYNNGELSRDFTYIDDISHAIIALMDKPPHKGGANSVAPFQIVNIGNSAPTALMDFIKAIEKALGKEAQKNYLPMQAGDVYATWANTKKLHEITGFQAKTPLEDGVKAFVDWYKSYY